MIFSLLFDGIPPHSSPHPFSADFSWQPINRQSRISRFLPLRATTFLRWFFLGFVTTDPVPLTSSVVLRLRSASVVFIVVTPLRPIRHYCPISLLFHSSPSPTTGGPGDSTTDRTSETNLALHQTLVAARDHEREETRFYHDSKKLVVFIRIVIAVTLQLAGYLDDPKRELGGILKRAFCGTGQAVSMLCALVVAALDGKPRPQKIASVLSFLPPLFELVGDTLLCNLPIGFTLHKDLIPRERRSKAFKATDRHCEYMNACMIKDYVPPAPHHVVDHRYFFATQSGDAEIGPDTCGIAREAVARALRLYGRNTSGDYQFLLRALTTFTNSPSVTGFLIEQTVLSSIGARGLDIGEEISSPMETIGFRGEFPEIEPDIKLALYCPLRSNFPGIDRLVVRFNKETMKC